MISFSHVSKRYGDKLALADVTVTIRSGHITGLLGPNGAGKSTAMRLLLGLEYPTQGSVLIGEVSNVDLFRRPLPCAG